jgi:uncharacterized protein YbjT (DUF2867 family)
VARVLIVGCGCRGQELARALVTDGHVVRGTTRSRERFDAIAEAGAEPVLADPDRVGTVVAALDAVAVVVWLLGRVRDPELHGPRLRALFEKVVDTMVRGVVLEPAGEGDATIAREAAATWSIPVTVLDGDSPHKAVTGMLTGIDSQYRESR